MAQNFHTVSTICSCRVNSTSDGWVHMNKHPITNCHLRNSVVKAANSSLITKETLDYGRGTSAGNHCQYDSCCHGDLLKLTIIYMTDKPNSMST